VGFGGIDPVEADDGIDAYLDDVGRIRAIGGGAAATLSVTITITV
jgi:hypothetical protein